MRDFILRNYGRLEYSTSLEAAAKEISDSPKPRQRSVGRQLERPGVGTKSQQALRMQREAMKAGRRQTSHKQRAAEARRLFDMKRQKRKERRQTKPDIQ